MRWEDALNFTVEYHYYKLLVHPSSVAMARAVFFATLGNKLHKITKVFEELDPIKSRGVLCQLQAIWGAVPEIFKWLWNGLAWTISKPLKYLRNSSSDHLELAEDPSAFDGI